MKKIFNNILHRIKEDSLSKRKDLATRDVEYHELKDIKKYLVFWTADAEQDNWLKRLAEIFREAKMDKLCFVAADGEMRESTDQVIMKKEDLGFGGKIQNERLLELLERHYDLLIDLTPSSSVLGNYVLTNSRAKCIIGMKKDGGVGDLIIDGASGQMDFIEKLKTVLSEIKKY